MEGSGGRQPTCSAGGSGSGDSDSSQQQEAPLGPHLDTLLSGLMLTAADEVETVSAEVQTAVFIDAAVQCKPPATDSEELRRQALAPQLAVFLRGATLLCEEALQQNELVDVLADELTGLVDEDGGGGAPGGGCLGAGRSAATGLVEHHSFSDLVHSKGKVLAAVQWHPSRRGVAAVACTHPPPSPPSSQHALQGGARQTGAAAASTQQQQSQSQSHSAMTAAAPSNTHFLSQPPTGCILVWNHADSIHPETVLQAPAEALAFAFHPTQPHWLAAGLTTGQVALFNLQQTQQQQQQQQQMGAGALLPRAAAAGTTAIPGTSASAHEQLRVILEQLGMTGTDYGDGREDSSRVAAVLPTYVSLPEASQQAAVTDLQWLPGALVSRDGKLEVAITSNEGAVGTATASADSCTLFATTAADGSLLLWDMRITTRQRKAVTRDEEQPDWKPVLSLAAASTAKQPLPAVRFCPDARSRVGRYVLGSLEGELAVINAATFSTERKGSTDWVHNTVQQLVGHTGRVVALAFSPFFSDVLLAVGDSGWVLWRLPDSSGAGAGSNGSTPQGNGAAAEAGKDGGEGDRGQGGSTGACLAVFRSPFCEALYTCGCWSPSKPGTVIVGRQDGRLEAWDLLDRTHQPTVVAPVAPCALISLAVSPQPATSSSRAPPPQLLAVGDATGTLHLLELPRPLRRRGRTEVKAMAALLQHEEERLGAVVRRADARLAEQKVTAERQRAEAAAAAHSAVHRQQQQDAQAAARKDLQGGTVEYSAEERYLALEAEWHSKLLGARVAGGAGV